MDFSIEIDARDSHGRAGLSADSVVWMMSERNDANNQCFSGDLPFYTLFGVRTCEQLLRAHFIAMELNHFEVSIPALCLHSYKVPNTLWPNFTISFTAMEKEVFFHQPRTQKKSLMKKYFFFQSEQWIKPIIFASKHFLLHWLTLRGCEQTNEEKKSQELAQEQTIKNEILFFTFSILICYNSFWLRIISSTA